MCINSGIAYFLSLLLCAIHITFPARSFCTILFSWFRFYYDDAAFANAIWNAKMKWKSIKIDFDFKANAKKDRQ